LQEIDKSRIVTVEVIRMIKLSAIAVLVSALVSTAMTVRADDDYNYPQPCTFQAHTTVGTVSGTCATLQVPLPGYHSRWTLTLHFDAASMALARGLKPDQFADMVRTQSAENGTDIIVLGLWGDLEVVPTVPEYLADIQASAPTYETRPNLITITQTSTSPLKLQLLFEEPADYLNLDTRRPSEEWWREYQRSYYRLGTNRPTGFSGSDATVRKPPAKRPTKSQMQN
jgi:hypothetical protein